MPAKNDSETTRTPEPSAATPPSQRVQLAARQMGYLRKRLLDLSNRNPLLNFRHRERSRSQIRLIEEPPDRLYARLADGGSLTFKALPEPEDEPKDERTFDFFAALEEARHTDEIYIKEIAESEEDDAASKHAQQIERELRDRVRERLGLPKRAHPEAMSMTEYARRQGVDPSYDLPDEETIRDDSVGARNNDIQTLLLPSKLERKLGGLHDLYWTNLDETGVNTLYVAFGFLEWYDSNQSGKPMHAPLLLHPVECRRELKGRQYRYSLVSTGEETALNLTLSERLRQDVGICLPEWAEEETPESYFRKVRDSIQERKGWRIRRWITIGHFAFARLVMYRDLASERWPIRKSFQHHPTLVDLFGGRDRDEPLYAEEYDIDQPEVAGKVPAIVTEADSSQFSALVDAMEGRNLAIKGPPGTGKSQTITNIIAAAMAAGKRVLFVAEKMAALEVVKSRLDAAGLGEFCLELHSTKARKKELLENLEQRLGIQKQARRPSQMQSALEEIKETRTDLREYAELMNREVGQLGKTLHELIWAEQRLRADPDIPPEVGDIRVPDAEQLTAYTADRRKQSLRAIEERVRGFQELYGGIEKHPWYGVRRRGDSAGDADHLMGALQQWQEAVKGLQGELTKVEAVFQGGPVPGSLSDIESFVGDVGAIEADLEGKRDVVDARLLAVAMKPDALESLRQRLQHQSAGRAAYDQARQFVSDPEQAVPGRERLDQIADELARLGLQERHVGELSTIKQQWEADAAWWDRVCRYANRLLKMLGLSLPLNADSLHKPIQALRLLESTDRKVLGMREAGLLDDANAELLRDAAQRSRRLDAEIERWQTDFHVSFDDPSLAERLRSHAQSLEGAGRLGSLRPAARQAKRFYQSCRRRQETATPWQMAAEMKALADVIEKVTRFRHDETLHAVCGARFRGLESEFESFVAVNELASSVRSTLGGDKVGKHLRGVLLNADLETLDEILALSREPARASLEEAIESAWSGNGDLEACAKQVKDRAEAVAALEQAISEFGMRSDVALSSLSEVKQALRDLAAAQEHQGGDDPILGEIDCASLSPEQLDNASHAAQGLAEQLKGRAYSGTLTRYLMNEAFWERLDGLKKTGEQLLVRLQQAHEASKQAIEVGEIDAARFLGGAPEEISLSELARRLEVSCNAREDLVSWQDYLKAVEDVRQDGLDALLNAYDRHGWRYEKLTAAFDRALLCTLINQAYEATPSLREFSGIDHEQARKRFRELDQELLSLQRRNLRAQLSQQKIDQGDATGSRASWTGLKLIQHEAGKRRRHLPIRDLFSRAGRAIQQMKPCFMMSPLSVAQFLKPGETEFDLVLIDEASQMRPEDALGSIARGKQLIVVGDPMQLPPTSFFERHEPGADDEGEAAEIADNESILDLMLSVYRPARQLRWHYRSRHGSLIAFSNHHFYQDDLIVFPSPVDRHEDVGVKKIFVGGEYRGRVNPTEAKQVARSAIDLMKRHPSRSVGVVALNQPQRELLVAEIDRLIAEDEQAQAYLERWESHEEGLNKFFVKNLENVQGDERDVILISTVYGPEAESGRVMQRFGPINSEIGHRRLNVLFTRAKNQILVFTSMNPTDIKVTESSRYGVTALRDFLEYAESGKLSSGETVRGQDSENGCSDFQSVCLEWLKEEGFEAVPKVGVKGYTLDVAVKDPENPQRFLLAIESDGANYISSLSTRDRDRLREAVLKNLGWNLYRAWSPDWLKAPTAEMRKLVQTLKDKKQIG